MVAELTSHHVLSWATGPRMTVHGPGPTRTMKAPPMWSASKEETGSAFSLLLFPRQTSVSDPPKCFQLPAPSRITLPFSLSVSRLTLKHPWSPVQMQKEGAHTVVGFISVTCTAKLQGEVWKTSTGSPTEQSVGILGSLKVLTAIGQRQSTEDIWPLDMPTPHHAHIHSHTLACTHLEPKPVPGTPFPSITWTKETVLCWFPLQPFKEGLKSLPGVQEGCWPSRTLSQEGTPLGRRNESEATER